MKLNALTLIVFYFIWNTYSSTCIISSVVTSTTLFKTGSKWIKKVSLEFIPTSVGLACWHSWLFKDTHFMCPVELEPDFSPNCSLYYQQKQMSLYIHRWILLHSYPTRHLAMKKFHIHQTKHYIQDKNTSAFLINLAAPNKEFLSVKPLPT